MTKSNFGRILVWQQYPFRNFLGSLDYPATKNSLVADFGLMRPPFLSCHLSLCASQFNPELTSQKSFERYRDGGVTVAIEEA